MAQTLIIAALVPDDVDPNYPQDYQTVYLCAPLTAEWLTDVIAKAAQLPLLRRQAGPGAAAQSLVLHTQLPTEGFVQTRCPWQEFVEEVESCTRYRAIEQSDGVCENFPVRYAHNEHGGPGCPFVLIELNEDADFGALEGERGESACQVLRCLLRVSAQFSPDDPRHFVQWEMLVEGEDMDEALLVRSSWVDLEALKRWHVLTQCASDVTADCTGEDPEPIPQRAYVRYSDGVDDEIASGLGGDCQERDQEPVYAMRPGMMDVQEKVARGLYLYLGRETLFLEHERGSNIVLADLYCYRFEEGGRLVHLYYAQQSETLRDFVMERDEGIRRRQQGHPYAVGADAYTPLLEEAHRRMMLMQEGIGP